MSADDGTCQCGAESRCRHLRLRHVLGSSRDRISSAGAVGLVLPRRAGGALPARARPDRAAPHRRRLARRRLAGPRHPGAAPRRWTGRRAGRRGRAADRLGRPARGARRPADPARPAGRRRPLRRAGRRAARKGGATRTCAPSCRPSRSTRPRWSSTRSRWGSGTARTASARAAAGRSRPVQAGHQMVVHRLRAQPVPPHRPGRDHGRHRRRGPAACSAGSRAGPRVATRRWPASSSPASRSSRRSRREVLEEVGVAGRRGHLLRQPALAVPGEPDDRVLRPGRAPPRSTSTGPRSATPAGSPASRCARRPRPARCCCPPASRSPAAWSRPWYGGPLPGQW